MLLLMVMLRIVWLLQFSGADAGLATAGSGFGKGADPQPNVEFSLSDAPCLDYDGCSGDAACPARDADLQIVKTTHHRVASMKAFPPFVRSYAPVNRGRVAEFESLQFDAWSPIGRKSETDGCAKRNVVGEDHRHVPPFPELLGFSVWPDEELPSPGYVVLD
jgi:hypothetical protein